MAPEFVIAILLCLGDSCDLVRPEPDITYPTYEACSAATAKNEAKLAEIAAKHREQGREGEIICLRDITPQSKTENIPRTPAPTPSAPTPQAARIPTPEAPRAHSNEFRDCEHCPVMVTLPGGSFAMGGNSDASERPIHRVTIAPFAIGKYEVSEAEWAACVAGGGCSYKPKEGEMSDRIAMTNLAWDDAVQYTKWLSKLTGKPYRLPSEAEWEYAARAGTTTQYSWGNEIGVGKANCNGCGGTYNPRSPAAIGSFAPNAWGLYDMLGGVAEWTEDCWHPSYRGAPANGTAWQAKTCATRVLRGGSWMNPPSDLTVSSRNYYDAPVRYIANGMRIALTLK